MGFFDEAGVEVNDISDDPFGFGNGFWPVRLVEISAPEVTKNGDKYGSKIKWVVEHPQFDKSFVSDPNKGMGNWLQLPPPIALQQSMGWDNSSPDAKRLFFNLKKLFTALGFKADEMAHVGPEQMLNKLCLAKVRVTQNDAGFWQFNVQNHKPMGEDSDGANEFTAEGQSNGKTPEQLLEEELNS